MQLDLLLVSILIFLDSIFLVFVILKYNLTKLFFAFFKEMFGGNKLIKSVNILIFNIKSINLAQKYPQIIESYVCILQLYAIISSLPIIFF